MAKEPAARYQKAAELRNALADFVDGSRAPAADATNGTRAIEPRATTVKVRKGPLSARAMVAIVTGAVAIMVLAAALLREREHPPAPRVETLAPVTAALPITPHRPWRRSQCRRRRLQQRQQAKRKSQKQKPWRAAEASRRQHQQRHRAMARSRWPFRRGARLASMGRRAACLHH